MTPLGSVLDWPLDFWGLLKVKLQAQSQTRQPPQQVKRLHCSFRSSPPSGFQPLLPPLCSFLPVCSLRQSPVLGCQVSRSSAMSPRTCPEPHWRKRSEFCPEASFKPHCCIWSRLTVHSWTPSMKPTSAALLTTPAASTDDSSHPLSIHTPCPPQRLSFLHLIWMHHFPF